VRKWVRKHKDAQIEAMSPSVPSVFIPVRVEAAADNIVSRHNAQPLDLKVRNSGEIRQTPANAASFSSAAKLHVSLPDGVKLSLECDDARALTALIGAVSNV